MTKVPQNELLKLAVVYREALVAYAYGILRDWALSEDAVEEAFLVLMEKSEEYQPGRGVYLWVRQMVHYKALALRHKSRPVTSLEEQALDAVVARVLEDGFDEDVADEHNRIIRALHVCMKKLSDTARRILKHYYWDSRKCEHIAVEVGQTVASVWHVLSRVRVQLRTCIQKRIQQELGEI